MHSLKMTRYLIAPKVSVSRKFRYHITAETLTPLVPGE